MGHKKVISFEGECDEASWQLLYRLGLTPSRLRKERTPMEAVDHHMTSANCTPEMSSAPLRRTTAWRQSVSPFHEMRNYETGEVVADSIIVEVRLNAAASNAQALPLGVREKASRSVEDQK
jgi:hypothetical protein